VIGGLILAAGGGTRFGPDPKLLADIDGQPVLQRTIDAMTQVRALDRIVVVLGAHAEEILPLVTFGRAQPVICTRWHDGQSASLRCGVDALTDAAKIVVALGDQPLINPQIVERFTREPPGVRAAYQGNPGHPVVLGPEHMRAIRRLTGDRGARDILNGPLIESADLGAPRDLDTPKDLAAIRGEAAGMRPYANPSAPAEAQLAGQPVPRIGYGTMRLTGPGVLGPPADRAEALQVLERALQLGIRVFDTAWYYGPDIPNQLLAQTLRADPRPVVIATKLGWEYDRHRRLVPAHSPEKLREGMQRDLRLLGAGSVAIVHLRWADDRATSEPFRRALAAMIEMREDGSFQHIGLSNVGLGQLEYALSRTDVASVSNSFSVADQTDGDLVDFTARHGIAYMPWLPLRGAGTSQALAISAWAPRLDATSAQVALAWLLQRAPNILPIPGTARVSHLEENVAARELRLPEAAMDELSARAT